MESPFNSFTASRGGKASFNGYSLISLERFQVPVIIVLGTVGFSVPVLEVRFAHIADFCIVGTIFACLYSIFYLIGVTLLNCKPSVTELTIPSVFTAP